MKLRVLGGRRTWAILALVALMASLLAVAPAAAGSETYEYQFEFVNGQTITGVSSDKTALLTNAGGAFADAPSGMTVHLSCSDKFPGGWGEKDGPKADVDSAWQIASFSISKIKDGKVDKTCASQAIGDVPADGEFYSYRFEFVNGQVVEGTSTEKNGFVPDAGGTDPNNPVGMKVHLSCSDDFPDGWGEKEGPDPVADSAWQILRYEISKYKDGKLDKTCAGGLPQPPPPPPDPSIDLEKFVNGEDADDPTGPVVNVGEFVTISYEVTNTGNVTLTDVVVDDADLGLVTCPLDTLAPGESMSCNEAQVLVENEGQQFMEADVTGHADVGGTPAPMPTDPNAKTKSFAFTFVNGQVVTGFSDDNTAFLPNAGGTDPNNPTGMDVHVSCSDKFAGGWGEKDGPVQGVDTAWQIASYSIVKWDKGEIDKTCGETFTQVKRTVTDNDPVYYFAVEPSDPSIDIEKTVNGIDADEPPGPTFTVGDTVTIEYIVTNTGNVKLTDIVVFDFDLGVRNCPKTMLEPGESMSCDPFVETLHTPGAVFMEAEVTGTPPVGDDVTDKDPINFTVIPDTLECSVELIDDTAVVTWSAAAGAVEYEVYRNTGRLGRTTDTMWVDKDLPVLLRLWYSVAAIDAAGDPFSLTQCGDIIYNPSE